MRGKKSALANKRFGRLLAIRNIKQRQGTHIMWLCICDCGNLTLVRSESLTVGRSQSCGCLQKEKASSARRGKKHSQETKLKMSEKAKLRIGDRSSSWVGGTSSYYHNQARQIWEEYWGESIPHEYLIHHLDKNYKNNHIPNLVMVTYDQHSKMHSFGKA